MFERPHHQRIAQILSVLNGPLLKQNSCLFGGGTYGQTIRSDLEKAIQRLQTRHGWLERCMQAMAMIMPKALVWQRVRALRNIHKG